MLVLSRKNGERVIIRDRKTGKIVCTVTNCGPQKDPKHADSMRFGFEASNDYEINREEVDKDKEDGK